MQAGKSMRQEEAQLDYSELSMQGLIDKLYKLKSKQMYDLSTDELEALADGCIIDVDALTDELEAHIEVLGAMKRIYEEILCKVCNGTFDD